MGERAACSEFTGTGTAAIIGQITLAIAMPKECSSPEGVPGEPIRRAMGVIAEAAH
jgi:hypothetical protein